MWDELYTWMEEHSGCAYDMREDIERVSDDEIFIDTHAWHHNMHYVLEKLSEAIDVVDENWKQLPDTLPTRVELKKLITSDVLGGLVHIIYDIERKLNIDPTDINSVDQLQTTIETLFDLVEALKTMTMDELSKTDWFNAYDDENDDVLTDTFGIHPNDLPNMQFTIQSIVELHEDEAYNE